MSAKKPSAKLGRPTRVPGEKRTGERIFDAAVELFAERGYDGTSLRQIAEAVGLTESAVYRHYPSKEAILEAIIAYMESRVSGPLPEGLDQGGGGGSIFRDLLLPLPRTMLADPCLVRIARIMYAEMHHRERIREYLREGLSERAVDAIEELFRRQAEEGSIRSCDFRALARVFNAFRAEWIFETFIVDRDAHPDAAKLEEDLRAPIELFEKLLTPGDKGK
jgi:AcrR family transcriptional regulator